MKKMVYLVYDRCDVDTLVGVYASRESAQYAVYEHVTDGEKCYTYEEWAEFAADNGYDTVEQFQEYIKICDDYNEELEMEIVVEKLRD